MLSPDFVFTVIFIILVPLALICTACVVADTVLAYIRHREEQCWNCMYGHDASETETVPEKLEENDKPEFVQND